MSTIAFTIRVKTTNPNNGAIGNSRLGGIIRARMRKAQRRAAWMQTLSAVGLSPQFPVVVTVCRVAPSSGLDVWDGLGAALKATIDGIADGLGLKSDRDARVTWVLAQRRGPAGLYSVEVTIEPTGAALSLRAAPGAS
jgi:hypothetical protein